MKKLLFLLPVLCILLASCVHRRVIVVHRAGHMPPGQVKKVTGSKSAAPYAPGQRKKRVRGY